MNAHTKISASHTAIATANAARPTWEEAYRAYRAAEAHEIAVIEDPEHTDEESMPACSARYAALKALIEFPAPSLDALAIKLAIYAGDDGHEFTDAAILETHLAADALRLAGEVRASFRLQTITREQIERTDYMLGAEREEDQIEKRASRKAIFQRVLDFYSAQRSADGWHQKLAAFQVALDAESEGATLEDNGQLSMEELKKLSDASDAALGEVFCHPASTAAAVIEKIDLFFAQHCDTQQFAYAVEAIKRDIRRLSRTGVPAERCGASTPFSDTLAKYEALRVAFNASDPEDNSLQTAYLEAHSQLIDAEPTSTRDFVGKFRSLWIEGGNPADDVVEMMLADADRLLAPAAPSGDPAAAAWQSFADNLRLLMEEEGEDEREALADKMDEADLVLARPSASLLGIAGKLRRVFQCSVGEPWSDEVCLLPIGAPRDERVNDACFLYQMLWSAIEDVERMALTTAQQAISGNPSSDWREKLMRLCAASEAMSQAGDATDSLLEEEQQALDAIIEHPVETPFDLALKGLIYDYHCYADIEHEDGAGRRALVSDALRVTGCSDIQRLHSLLAEYAGHGQEQTVHA